MATLLGCAVGLMLGLTGAGGSMLAVPLLMWAMNWSLTQAVPVALLAVCAAALVGTLIAWRRAEVRYRAALLMGAMGTLTAPLGFAMARTLPRETLTLAFAAVAAIIAWRLFRQAWRTPTEARVVRADVANGRASGKVPVCGLNATTGRINWTVRCAAVLSFVGASTGVLSALLGVGGGFVVVPALRATTDLSMHAAVATSLMVIAITSAGAVGVHLLGGATLPLAQALPFVAGALLGMGAGRVLAPRIAGPRLQQGFAVVMAAVALVMAADVARN